MAENSNELELLKICIDDEHHYRTMVQSRVSYYTSIILALIALAGALTVRADNSLDFFVVALLGALISYVAKQATNAIERLYDHFIEAIRAREEIEIQIGLRDITKNRKSSTEPPRTLTSKTDGDSKYWNYNEALFVGSWIPPKDTGGYFSKTQKTFGIFFVVGVVMIIVMILISIFMAAS